MPGMANGSSGTTPPPGKIVIYSHSWLPGQVDGVAVRMMAHVSALVARGVKVIVVTPSFVLPWDKSEPPQLNEIPGVRFVTVETQLTPVYHKNYCMSFSMGSLIRLVGLLRSERPDLVHATQEASIQVMATACALCDVPLVISMHTDVTQILTRDMISNFSFRGAFKYIHYRAAVIATNVGYRNWARTGVTFFTVSPQAKAILKDAGVSDTQVVSEEWGPMVDRETFRIDLPEEEVQATRQRLTFGMPDAFLLVYVGRVTAEKDVQFLVDALARGPKQVVLALIGPGSLVEELSKLHGKEHRLHCTGEFLARPEVALCLRAADCCVSASTMETIGFTAMEALSCGTPMLAANAQGFALHLTPGVNARLFTPHDEESFDHELNALLETPREGTWTREALRESMSHAAIDECTDRCLSGYREAQLPGNVAVFWGVCQFVMNWFVNIFMP